MSSFRASPSACSTSSSLARALEIRFAARARDSFCLGAALVSPLIARTSLSAGANSLWPAPDSLTGGGSLNRSFSKSLQFKLNFGAQYNDGDPRGLFATGGVGVSWNFVPRWSVISEVFAIMGSGQSNPRFQSGIRYSPTKNVDWDLIYGRNLTGEGANWITLALTVRIRRD